MIDWVHELCREWGDARYYIENGDANPSSIWGRMREGWSIAAAEHSERPCPPEVMLNGALAVSIALRKAIAEGQMRENSYRVMYLHYAERAPTKKKIYALKLSKKRYYELLHRCHRVIRHFLPEEHQQNETLASQGDKIAARKAA